MPLAVCAKMLKKSVDGPRILRWRAGTIAASQKRQSICYGHAITALAFCRVPFHREEHDMSASEIQKTRVINELRGFIKKLLQDPQILEQSLVVARKHLAEGSDATIMARIANDISDTTSVHIPEDPSEHSEADKLYLELLKEIVGEEQAMY
tara:strand:- start:12564 stop:13019 length:456 start_codon:yes stop_codon:yes gene_type:complete